MRDIGVELAEPGTESPLDAAISQRDRGTLAMVQQALGRGDARLAFQPIMRSDGRGIAFFEGLIRLLDETGRIIPARDFMGAVEDSDIGRQIDCAALQIGLQMLKQHPWLRLSINMSARSVGYPRWMQILRTCLRDHPTVAERLILEITESSVMMMPEIVAIFMEDMQDKGITFALDDFGAGYTAFRHFKTFYFDILKIDGQFSRNIAEDADNQVLSEALISLAKHFDMLVVAESVETEAEAKWLAAAGADCLQGYYFGPPTLKLPEGDLRSLSRSA
ncbi:EAL domain-containing protein [Hasllibacter sp. MH4015]|uniref:EAL domain-containing protein n=1 Tax=Hasllibacter sp. MH4015 TaxID=2854029 RepID=UPI001CD2B681|nr:EAL domain-containing protein [Hasllibacter sp. MH4015]